MHLLKRFNTSSQHGTEASVPSVLSLDLVQSTEGIDVWEGNKGQVAALESTIVGGAKRILVVVKQLEVYDH